MELLLISPLGLDYSPDLVASKFCQHRLLQTAPREFYVSSDCLAFASAFQSQLKCIYSVNYDWDEQHTPAKPEPERHKVFHPTDWTVEETYERFVKRVWEEVYILKLRMRVVLCTSAVIKVISGLDGLSMCKFVVQPGNIQATDRVSYEEISQLFASERFSALKQQNIAKAQAIASVLTPVLAQFLSQIHSDSAAFPPLLTTILTEQITTAVGSLELMYSQTEAATLSELQRKWEGCASKIADLKAVIRGLEEGQQASLAIVQTLGQEKRAGGAVEPRIADLQRTIGQFEGRMKTLYDEIPDQKVKKPPLKLTVSESGQYSVENRKKYALESLELLYTAEAQTQKLLDFTAPPGLSLHQVPFPHVTAQVLSFVIKQNGQEVCRPIEFVLEAPLKSPLDAGQVLSTTTGPEFRSGAPLNFHTVPTPKPAGSVFPPLKGGVEPGKGGIPAPPGVPSYAPPGNLGNLKPGVPNFGNPMSSQLGEKGFGFKGVKPSNN